tara:strand:- start:3110 stop:4327 length:1218 start_codon:yes stop_codon:yes gene_type:complete
MPLFWTILISLLMLSLAIIWHPYFSRRTKKDNSDVRFNTNLDIFNMRLNALKQQRRNSDIDDTEFHQLKTELERALLQDVDTTTASAQPKREHKPSKLLPYSLSALMFIGCISFYLYLGQGASFKASGEMLEPESSQAVKGVIAYVEELRVRLEKNPKDQDAWTQLGQFYMEFNLYEQALTTYDRLLQLSPNNPEFMGQKATALYFVNQQSMTPEIDELIKQALNKDATQPSVHFLLAIHAYLQKDFTTALTHWQKLLNSQRTDINREAIESTMAQIRQEQQEFNATPSNSAQINLSIDLAAALKQDIQPNDVLFVFAQSIEGGMPLAVIRQPVKQFPLRIQLSDKNAMRDNLKLSQEEYVSVTVRVSHHGSAPAKPGDLQGHIEKVSTSNTQIQKIVINTKINI